MIETFIITFFLSILLNIFFQKYFIKNGSFDKVNFRSSHKVNATRSGGSSFFSTLFLISLFFYFTSNQIFDFKILIPLAILFTVGLYDDIYEVDFKLKFIFQFIVAKIIVDQGFLIATLNGFIGIYEIPYMVSQIITILLIIFIINAINFTDGIDGLAITEANKFIFLTFIINGVLNFNGLGFLLSITLISLLPLYYFNLKSQNKVFLGDSGSLALGGIVSIGMIYTINSSELISSLSTPYIILVLFTYPLVDTIYVISNRVINGKSPFYPDKKHIHHLLLNMGFSHSKSLLIISGLTFMFQLLLIYLTSSSQ